MAIEDALSEKIRKKKMRKKFVVYLVLTFAIFSILSWIVLPMLDKPTKAITSEVSKEAKMSSDILDHVVTAFKIGWVFILIGCGVAGFLSWQGMIDGLIPPLQLVLILLSAGAIGVTFFAYYSRITSISIG